MAVTEQQIGVYMSHRRAGKDQDTAAAKAGFSERTARRVEHGQGGRSQKSRHWRTRPDPFATVWESEVVPELERDGDLQALTLLEAVCRGNVAAVRVLIAAGTNRIAFHHNARFQSHPLSAIHFVPCYLLAHG